jgi:hypothetical protein
MHARVLLLLLLLLLQCYSTNPTVARGYFVAFVELFKSQDVAHPLPVLFLLIIFKVRLSSPPLMV